MRDLEPCVVCGRETENREAGLPLCYEHAAIAHRLAQLTSAQTPFDTVVSRSHGLREDPDGKRSTYQLAREGDIERVLRDVNVVISDVPVFAVEALFDRLHNELGRPDIGHAAVTLEVSLEGLDEDGYARLDSFTDKLWMASEYEVTRVRLYPPKRLMDEKVRQVDEARRQERDSKETA